MHVKRSKSWDMKYNWLCDRTAQKQFHVKWDKGIHNMADYFTKYHPPLHHQSKGYDSIKKVSIVFIKYDSKTSVLQCMHQQGCVEVLILSVLVQSYTKIPVHTFWYHFHHSHKYKIQ